MRQALPGPRRSPIAGVVGDEPVRPFRADKLGMRVACPAGPQVAKQLTFSVCLDGPLVVAVGGYPRRLRQNRKWPSSLCQLTRKFSPAGPEFLTFYCVRTQFG